MTHRVTRVVATFQSGKVERLVEGHPSAVGTKGRWAREARLLAKEGALDVMVTSPAGKVIYWWHSRHGRIDK